MTHPLPQPPEGYDCVCKPPRLAIIRHILVAFSKCYLQWCETITNSSRKSLVMVLEHSHLHNFCPHPVHQALATLHLLFILAPETHHCAFSSAYSPTLYGMLMKSYVATSIFHNNFTHPDATSRRFRGNMPLRV